MAVVYVIVILVAFVCVYPIYFTVIASFSDAYEVYSGKTFLLPKGFNIMSYELVFQNKDIWIGYANTILYTVLGTLLNIFLTIPAAYALSRPNILGQGILMKIFLRLHDQGRRGMAAGLHGGLPYSGNALQYDV